MADVNVVALTGRLTRDAELKYTQGGMAVSSFSIAVNRAKKEGDKWVEVADFFDCTHFGKLAEKLTQYMRKGVEVTIQGSLRQERWQSKEGQNRSKVGVVVEEIKLGARPKGQTSPNDFTDDIPEGPRTESPRGDWVQTARQASTTNSAPAVYDNEEIPF